MTALFSAQAGVRAQAQAPAQATTPAQVQATTPTPTPTPTCSSDVVTTADNNDLVIGFFGHASIAFEYAGLRIYVDPVSDYADYAALPPADLILLTHEHGDHLDPRAIGDLGEKAAVWGNATAIEALGRGQVMTHGQVRVLDLFVEASAEVPTEVPTEALAEVPTEAPTVEAVPAYNTSPEKQGFHPASRLHNGYILTFGGTRVYVAGDTEPIPEMAALGAVDIAFLPVNLPYTMTEQQAASAVRTIGPAIFYPYHYGGTDHKTDLSKLAALIEGSGIEMRVRPLE